MALLLLFFVRTLATDANDKGLHFKQNNFLICFNSSKNLTIDIGSLLVHILTNH